MITTELVKKAAKGPVNEANLNSVVQALVKYSGKFGLDRPHREAQYLAQLMHESGAFKYDKEIWGPTPAQERYDTRTDLGNTKAKDGDGKKYMGRGPTQITGKGNYEEFRNWCRKYIDADAPDFVKNPELVNTDPWEGLTAIWYWSTRNLNRYADTGDIETITKKINGGMNGFDDRVDYYVRIALVMLDRPVNSLKQFQAEHKLVPDGDPGPKTRSALHEALVRLVPGEMKKESVQVAPVVETVLPAQVKKDLDKPLSRSRGLWERVTSIGGLGAIAGATWWQDWRIVVAIAGSLIVLALFGIFFHKRLIDAVKAVNGE